MVSPMVALFANTNACTKVTMYNVVPFCMRHPLWVKLCLLHPVVCPDVDLRR